MRSFLFCILALSVLTVNAQNINVRGVVTDTKSGKVLPNATVTLLHQLLKDTTAVNTGAYAITKGTISVIPNLKIQNGSKLSLVSGVLKLNLTTQAQVKVETFNVKGDLLKKDVLPSAAAGVHNFNIAENNRATNLLIVKVAIGDQTTTFRYLPEHNNNFAINAFVDNSTAANKLAKTAAAISDTLHFTANGYLTKLIPITSYDTIVNITLDSLYPGPSIGCGKTLGSLNKSGTYTIKSSNVSRTYIIDIPANYDKNKPYRLIFGMHCMGGSAIKVSGTDNGQDQTAYYYHIKPLATKDSIQAIYIAPQGNGDGTWDPTNDPIFFSDLLTLAKDTLCIDTNRVFSCGFSFGAMFTYALSLEFPKALRAVCCYAPANYNFGTQPTNQHIPIGYFQTTGISDPRCPWINDSTQSQGGKYCLIEHIKDNGCILPATIPLTTSATHLTTNFVGGLRPAKFCSFQGQHQCNATDPGSTTDWIPIESWEFLKRF